jgi:prevent-host-death family protein
MKTTHISLTEAKQRLGELVKRSAYGGERFVIEFRGKPAAVVVSYNGAVDEDAETRKQRGLKALEDLREFREKLKAKYGVFPDSAELIREMREERDNQILGLR